MATRGVNAAPPVASATLGAYPVEMGMPGALGNLDRMPPQVNATNQSALANNGTVNQEVSNTNTYNNNYYNFNGVQASPFASYPTYQWENAGMLGGGFGYGGSIVDSIIGTSFHGQSRGGILGWFQRLFRGY